jgi:ABC-2 type transport system ATP-binding protein
MEAIETRSLSKQYGKRVACREMSLTVHPGEIFGLLGPNGAGKTSFVKMLADLVQPSGGEAFVFGEKPQSRAAKRRIAFLPEAFRFHQWLTGREVLRFHGRLYGLERSRVEDRIPSVLETVRLSGAEGYQVGSYSKGMQQRLGLAVTLLSEADIVMLDEPTSALDPIGRREVRELLAELRNRGMTVFLNSHLLSEVEMVSDRVAFVREGRIVQTGPLEEFLSRELEFEIELDGQDDGRARELLSGFGSVRAAREGVLTVSGIDRERIPDAIGTLAGAGLRIYAAGPRRRTLEDIFVEIMKAREVQGTDTGATDVGAEAQ